MGDKPTYDFPGATGMFGLDVMTAMTRSSIEAMQDWNVEVSRFITARLEQDRALQDRFSECRTPGEFFEAYSAFMSKAMQDYANTTQALQELSLEAASSAQQAAGAGFETMTKRTGKSG